MGAASDSGGQLPLGALAAAVTVKRSALQACGVRPAATWGALGLGLLLLAHSADGQHQVKTPPACSARLASPGPTLMAPPPPPGRPRPRLHHTAPPPLVIHRPRLHLPVHAPSPRPGLTQGRSRGAPEARAAGGALLHKTDAVAPWGVLAEAPSVTAGVVPAMALRMDGTTWIQQDAGLQLVPGVCAPLPQPTEDS